MISCLSNLLPCWHNWTNWEIYKHGRTMNARGSFDGYFFTQIRECKKCNLVQMRTDNV